MESLHNLFLEDVMKNLSFVLMIVLALFVATANAQTTATTPTPILKTGFSEVSLHVNVGWYIIMVAPVKATAYMGSGSINLFKDGKLVDCCGSATVRQITADVAEIEVYSDYFAYTTPEGFQKKFPVVMEIHGWKIEITGWVNPF